MTIQAPQLDKRTAPDIVRDVRRLLPEHRGQDGPGGFDTALIQVFARFGEIVISRLNKAPDKNFLAFLDLLGVSPLPMQAARVPLTFSLAPAVTGHAMVPSGTQASAPPPKGEKRPVSFETDEDLFVTPAKLDSLFAKDGTRDQYSDLSPALADPPANEAPELNEVTTPDAKPVPHILWLSLPVEPGWPSLDKLRLRFSLAEAGSLVDLRSVQWEACVLDSSAVSVAAAGTGANAKLPALKTIVLTPSADSTKSLTQSGDIIFANVPVIAPSIVNRINGVWLGCRLLTPLTNSVDPRDGMLRGSQLPTVKAVSAEMELLRKDLLIDAAFSNNVKLDSTKDFFPFGERPKFGDTLYLGDREAFSNPNAKITLRVELTNPSTAGPDPAIPRTKPNHTQLSWEFWDGRQWTKLVSSGHLLVGEDANGAVPPSPSEFSDDTETFSKNGDVTFTFSRPPAELTLNGQKNYWVRVRIVAGDYGATGVFGMPPVPPAPPSIRSLRLAYTVKKESQPRTVLTYNDFAYATVPAQTDFKPFIPIPPGEDQPSLYFGFNLENSPAKNSVVDPNNAPVQHAERQVKFPTHPISVYVESANSAQQEKSDYFDSRRASASWEYWNGQGWKQFPVPDQTRSLQRSGLIQFLLPQDFVPRQEFGKPRYWLRMRQDINAYSPKLRGIHLNTMMATQGVTVVNDILGASNGKPDQKFQTSQPTVLPGQKLEVREPTRPPLQERLRSQAEEGIGAIQETIEPGGSRTQFWVTWHEVATFYGSGPRDRHYVIDNTNGEVLFGDGVSGLIPPVLQGNIRMTKYRSGGGTRGNLPAQTIKQLVTAVPYIQKVINWEAASAGTDTETTSALVERGPRTIRHGGRAVTLEDYEDLAMLASREVARAKCVPLYDLTVDPNTKRRHPGVVSLIIAPHSTDPKPVPSDGLFDQVLAFVDTWRSPSAELVLVGPEYVRVDVSAEIVVDSKGAVGDVELAVKKCLNGYLHPITGGPNGLGWEFGRLPQRFDLYTLIQRVAGVSHVRNLRVSTVADRPGAERTNRFLACCGHHQISITLEEKYATQTA